MKIFDIIALCRQNLSRQKARTRLTVMGVTIGCCAIVLMMSLGIGSNEQTKVMLSNMGDLTAIEIWNYGGADRGNAITDHTLDSIRAIPNVDMVSPKKEFNDGNIKIVSGAGDRYSTSYAQVCGVDEQMLEKSGYKLKEGEYLKNTGSGFGRKPVNVVVGERFFYEFMDTKRPAGKNRRSFEDQSKYNSNDSYYMPENTNEEETKPFEEPFFSNIDAKLYLTIESYSDGQDEPKKFRQELKIVGVLKRDTSKDYYTVSGVYMSIKDMESIMKAVMSKKEYTEMMKRGYERVLVKAKEIKDVNEIEKSIKAMGYETSSMESIRESINKQTRQQQIMLAGLGGISLFVAAIGIMNTMIMSITERTKEIGIMKALGCYVNDIRKLFLFEAGAIGFIGGVVGVIISIFISFLINIAGILGLVQSSSSSMMDYGAGDAPSFFDKLANINLDFNTIYKGLTTVGSRTSIIPVWLIIFGLIFSTLIGLISGYHPANKAVKIPALEAIKHE